MNPKLQNSDNDNEKSILPALRSRLGASFSVSPIAIFANVNCSATPATFAVLALQAVKYICKAIFQLKILEF
ncbi:hypothetical protein [Nostoc sp. CALU 546]|uniref:hypothetical protein n=1 Tax=Nostoc sp. CALU 546 TaxID=1867241 RepID=UPI003B671E46